MSGYLESAITSLSKSKIYLEKERLLKILRFIWKQIKSAEHKEVLKQLQRSGCFKHLVNVLQSFANIEQTKLNVAIVITVISILGYSFQDRAIATEVVRQTLLLQVISRLLKHYKLNEVQNKIFRIICITCQHWNRLANTIIEREPAIVTEIVAFVNNFSLEPHRSSQSDDHKTDKTSSNATVMQALSALRCLLNGNTVVPLIKDFGVLSAIGSLLIKYYKDWERTKEHEEALRCIIKVLSAYSKYHYKSSISELKTTNEGCALEHLRKLVVLYPQGVVYITLNLSHVMIHKSDLCVTETAQILINQLRNPGDISGGKEGSLYREYLKSLILLLNHGCFRADICKTGVVERLIEIAHGCDILKIPEVKIYGIIIKMFACLPFDYTMMVELIEKGMVKVLADKLSVVGKDSCLADRRVEGVGGCNGKRCLSMPIESIRTKRMCLREPSPPMLREESFEDVIDIRSSSPSSTTSFLSPPSSPSCSNSYPCSNEPDSDTNYSPVCSDDENEADAESATDNTTESSDSSLDQAPESTLPDTGGSSEEADLKKALVTDSIRLLNLMSILPDFAKNVSYAEALSTLMLFRFDMDIYTIIHRAFEYPGASCLKLMQTDFVLKLYEYTTKKAKSDCPICLNQNHLVTELLNQLNSHIEVCGGKGDLAHLLLRGNSDLKNKLVPSIPLVVKSKALLNKLMVACGGLEVFLNILIEERPMLDRIVKGLNVLAQKIGIKHPVTKIKKQISCEGHLEASTSVTFLMDDGTEVLGNRDVLIQRSQYFEKLLSGHFKEATEEQIRISNVSSTTFKHLLQLVSSELDVVTVIRLDLALDLLLDLIALTDRYLMEDYCLCLTLAVQDYKLTSDSASTIYRWSLESGTNLLRVEVVVYTLVGGMVHSERVRVFEDLLDGGCAEHLVEDLRTLFARFLNLGISYA